MHGLAHAVALVTENSASTSHESTLRQINQEGGYHTKTVHPEVLDTFPRGDALHSAHMLLIIVMKA